ncbi:hypothetical protein T440DRAFT_240548 [Plenodomus tracheiphilus IPT5]|uniref:Uncharacterized protein n=1 Tax=Plenodomus tracheiphilus IPT5 TaxID=1408161 RepID=A0A6A7BGZ1_9PLEO|nr:hypothetical protein T440DRAFT_240548 [Plenodomus tracheiphilus IPT5]
MCRCEESARYIGRKDVDCRLHFATSPSSRESVVAFQGDAQYIRDWALTIRGRADEITRFIAQRLGLLPTSDRIRREEERVLTAVARKVDFHSIMAATKEARALSAISALTAATPAATEIWEQQDDIHSWLRLRSLSPKTFDDCDVENTARGASRTLARLVMVLMAR